MDAKLRNSFPEGFTPNHAQEVIISGIERAIEEKKKFIIINAPTGSGKSFISKTIANYSSPIDKHFAEILGETCRWAKLDFGDRYRFGTAVLTCTKNLQDQYASLFKDGSVLKGQINYECPFDYVPCDMGLCKTDDRKKDKCWGNRTCPYLNARYDTVTNKCAFYNYSMYMSLVDCVKWKDFIVCDEASELEDEMVTEFTLEIDLVTLSQAMRQTLILPDEGSPDIDYLNWLKELGQSLRNIVSELTTDSTGKRKTKIPIEVRRRIKVLDDVLTEVVKLIDNWGESEWFKIHGEGTIKFMPYQVDKLAQQFFRYANHVVLMSATIVNVQSFAKTLGIEEYIYIDAPSSFDPARGYISGWREPFRPNYKNKNAVIPQIAGVARQICFNEQYINKKGIIHTNSFDVLYMLKKAVGPSNKRFLYRQQGASNEDILDLHKESTIPTILVSPSMTHGVDLKGDLGEFQIIMKAPYPNLGDPRCKRKFKEDREWYVDKMLSTLIQACGRCNRTKDDLSITFILDYNAYEALVINRDKLPSYFRERMTKESAMRYAQLIKENEQ